MLVYMNIIYKERSELKLVHNYDGEEKSMNDIIQI